MRAVMPESQIDLVVEFEPWDSSKAYDRLGIEDRFIDILGEKLPGLDCVSFGPDLTDIHTPRERMHIASVQRTWKLLCEVLKRSK